MTEHEPTAVETTRDTPPRGYARALIATLAVIVLMCVVIAIATRGGEKDTPEAPLTALSEEEIALISASEWETWAAGPLTHYLVWLDAPGLDRPRVNASVDVVATDATGATHESSDWVTLRAGEHELLSGRFDGPIESEVVDLAVTVTNARPRAAVDYAASVENHSVDTAASAPTLRVRVVGTGEESVDIAWLTTVVRSADGEITHLGRTSLRPPPAPGQYRMLDVELRGSGPVDYADDIQFWFSY